MRASWPTRPRPRSAAGRWRRTWHGRWPPSPTSRARSTASPGGRLPSKRASCPRRSTSWWIRRRHPCGCPAVADSVLLIDDDADLGKALGDYFDRLGFEVSRAETGETGLDEFERVRPEVVILDLHLPDAGGLDVLERLRSRGGSVILLTGQGDIETAVRAMQLGAEHFLTKPVDLNHLGAAAARVVEKARLTRENELLRVRAHLAEGLDSLGVSPAMRELALELQPKLLKVLETKTFRRLGGTREITVDVRLVAATNRDLLSDVKAGRFREDLYYRLNVLPIHLPAVRDRAREDRLALLTRILAALHAELPGCPSACTSEALDRLLSAPWPGNIREMRNVVERAMILGQGGPAISVEHLPADLRKGAAGGAVGGTGGDRRHVPQTLADVERLQIEKTLRFHDGNRTRSAHELGISRATLINKIKVYGLDL